MSGELVHFPSGPARGQVVVTFPLSSGARDRLAERLGPGFRLVDIKQSIGDEELVLVPSASRQLTGKIRSAFPSAAVLVVEVEDAAFGVDFGGHVMRTLDAGADGYFVARSVDELASVVDQAAGRLDTETSARSALAASSVNDLDEVLDVLLADRQRAASRSNAEASRTSEPRRTQGETPP